MKKYLFTLIALVSLQTAFAQTDNYLIYREYDPDYWVELKLDSPFGHEFYYINIDDDENFDVSYSIWGEDHWTISQMMTHNGWEACNYRLRSRELSSDNNFYDLSIPLNDTSLVWNTCIYPEMHTYPDTIRYKTALRYRVGEDFYYGWAEFEEFIQNYSYIHPFYFHIVRTCFCAIPNYPLHWGQTSLTEGLDETEATAFVAVYPNPAKDIVTITGKDLKQAEVFNTLGQGVVKVQGQSETLQIDIANLPAGVYFVNITDEEGRKCVRKVVKE